MKPEVTRRALNQIHKMCGLFCRIDVILLLCIAQVQFFSEDIILCVSTEARFHLDKRPKISTIKVPQSISSVCTVHCSVFTRVLVSACPWMYNITLQWEQRKGGAGIQNYVMAASCLAFPRAPGDWKASRTPGCDFIKVWNERSVTRRSHTWHPAAGPFFPASSHSLGALMTPLWKSVSLIPSRDPTTALSASDTNLIPDRSVRWKPCLSRLLINVALLSVYHSVYLKFTTRVRTDGIVQRWLVFPFWLKCEF